MESMYVVLGIAVLVFIILAKTAVVVPQLLCEFQGAHPRIRVALEVHDTRTVVELVADRRLELGIVGAAPRHRA